MAGWGGKWEPGVYIGVTAEYSTLNHFSLAALCSTLTSWSTAAISSIEECKHLLLFILRLSSSSLTLSTTSPRIQAENQQHRKRNLTAIRRLTTIGGWKRSLGGWEYYLCSSTTGDNHSSEASGKDSEVMEGKSPSGYWISRRPKLGLQLHRWQETRARYLNQPPPAY